MGKGSRPRPVDRETYERNWENIFRKPAEDAKPEPKPDDKK